MTRLESIKQKIKMMRLKHSLRKDKNYDVFFKIINNNYSSLIEDITIGTSDFDNDVIKRALVIREAIDNDIDIDLLLNPKLNSAQTDVILSGLEEGLTKEEIKTYTNPKYNAEQMEQIKLGLIKNFDDSKMNFFNSPNYSAKQMQVIRMAFNQKLSAKQISLFANPKMHYATMIQVRNSIIAKKSFKEISQLKQKLQFANTFTMRKGLEIGMHNNVINNIVEKMSELHEYWDKQQFKNLIPEICKEISDNQISDLEKYFSEKFISEEPTVQSAPTPEQEQAEKAADKTHEKNEDKKVFSVDVEDETLKKQDEEQQLTHNEKSEIKAAAPKKSPKQPEVDINF